MGGADSSAKSTGRRAKRPTIIDVANAAGVSKSAVSRALLGQNVSESTRQRVDAAAEKLGYVANAVARGLVTERTKTLGVVMRDATNPFYAHVFAEMQARAEDLGYRLVTAARAGELSVDDAIGSVRALVSMQVDGLVVCSAQLPASELVRFTDRVPIIAAGRHESDHRFSSVCGDDVFAGSQLADHLADLGHRHVGVFLVDEAFSSTQNSRGRAMITRLTERNVSVTICAVASDDEAPSRVTGVLDDPSVTAIMCPTDTSLVGVLEECRKAGIDVPGDVSLTGFDGVGPLALPWLGLTTFRQPVEDIGRTAIDLLLTTLADGASPRSHRLIAGELVAGRTSSPPSRGAPRR